MTTAPLAPLLLSALVAACASDAVPAPGELRGATYSEPLPKPDFTLATTDGRPFDFRAETAGKVTLLFFGYTYCPDICPVHMANIAAVLERLPPPIADQVTVIMVTVDPERDTPERLRAWLDHFDRSFIGLVGPLDSVNAIQAALYLPAATKIAPAQGADSSAGYLVGHAASVIAFTRDDLAHVVYPFGIRQEDWAHDLPILARVWTEAEGERGKGNGER
jgi:protein SCO1/2